MIRTSVAPLLFCAVALAFACGESTGANFAGDDSGPSPTVAAAGGGPQAKTGLPCDVNEVLSTNCQTCHAAEPMSGASVSLVTWSDLQKEHGGKKVYELVKERIHAESRRMPPAGKLADAQLKSLDDWIAGGAKRADTTCEGEGPPPATRPFDCAAPAKTIVLKAATPFQWADNSKTDQYVCFGVDDVVGAKRHVISLGPKVDNLKIVHHVILFQTKDAMPNEAQSCGAVAPTGWKLITGWTPGGGNLDLPPEAGYPQEGTTHWVVQVHYNNTSGKNAGESDNSGYQICSTDQLRPYDAGTLAFGASRFTIPPRTPRYTVKCDYKLNDKYKGVKFFSASPHMHQRGAAVVTERLRGGKGTPEVMFAQDPFNFEDQASFKIDKTVEPGDVMRTHCSWKNPDDKEVSFGENTDDEMCFNFFAYYPAIPDQTVGGVPVQTWATPSLPIPITGAKCEEEK